ncbi:ribosome hibernation factor-recruiting GTPase MRF [Mycolicibacterium chlorophenolicum]|uniref:Putative metal chaperone YciC n=1 Tax=Mycolicibacterium chlorophenolicum TaxID=37916 RepID=A0A0J6VK54_9MYCO|nr:GTP-binding protein [Mycolicibacterium chlorophenolicum]KMO69957.1 putative metal chaperone YciC [Mycolicibacterium chlorophenolicum]
MRTPVVIVTGQHHTDDIARILLDRPGTALVQHHFDGHVVHCTTALVQRGITVVADTVLELTNCCVSCTVRKDLLQHLGDLHRRPDVDRIVVRLGPWMEPEPVAVAITRSPVARDVALSAVVATVDSATWLPQALGEEELHDGRTVAQVVVGQVEFADVAVLTIPDPETLAVVRRLAPRARVTVGTDRLELALAHLEPDARRGRSDDPHASLLCGQPPLDSDGRVGLVEFTSRRPFHPGRLHDALDVLLDGVVRSRGRLWLAGRPDRVMWLESAGGGLRVTNAGKWLAAMTAREVAYVNPERRAMAGLMWNHRHGDRHTSLAVLTCGATAREIRDVLAGALLTDAEMDRPHEWPGYGNPFGDWHADPCDDAVPALQTEREGRAED